MHLLTRLQHGPRSPARPGARPEARSGATPDRILTQKAIPKGNKTQGSQPQEIQRAPKPVPQLALGVDAQRTTGSSAHTFPDVHMPRAAPEKPQAGKKAQQQQQREKSQNPEPKPQPRIKYQTRPQRPLQA
ncbi:MAG: hypothetical protein GX281_05190 [Bacteroidales bacterium]|nr:hypothetical protein [Bacteroidales bacterium]NLK80092.1 hypothetical protein [Bacteroidales bacterium]